MAQSKPSSDWRSDDKTPDTKPKVTEQDVIADHKITERFMEQHKIEAAMVLICSIEGSEEVRSVYPLSEVDEFLKIKSVIAGEESSLRRHNSNRAAVHIDEFTIAFTDSSGQRMISKTKENASDTQRHFWELNSPDTFNAFMKAVTARVSVGPFPCTCGDRLLCKETKRCPEIKFTLSPVDGRNRRQLASGKKVPSDMRYVVLLDAPGVNVREAKMRKMQPPKLMINGICLLRLINTAKQYGRQAHANDDSDYSDESPLLSEVDEDQFDDPGWVGNVDPGWHDDRKPKKRVSTRAPLSTIDEVVEITDNDNDNDNDNDDAMVDRDAAPGQKVIVRYKDYDPNRRW